MKANRAKFLLPVAIVALLLGMLWLYFGSSASKASEFRVESPTVQARESNQEALELPENQSEQSPAISEVAFRGPNQIPARNTTVASLAASTNQSDKADMVKVSPEGARTNRPSWTPLELISIAPGSFTLGSPDNEQGRRANEGPETSVTLTYEFWLGKYEVTAGQFQAIVVEKLPWLSGKMTEDDLNRAVTMVSWEDATNFCWLLTRQEREAGRLPEGYVYRLPAEAEWEHACRAGTTSRFSFGDDFDHTLLRKHACYAVNSNGRVQPVGTKEPNPWGLYDMHGNVNEWCLDNLGKYPGGSLTNPLGSLSGRYHVIKGGAWNFTNPDDCRSGYRHPCTSSRYIVDAGFRVALGPPIQ